MKFLHQTAPHLYIREMFYKSIDDNLDLKRMDIGPVFKNKYRIYKNMFSLFARPKPCKILTTLKDTENIWYLSKLAKATETTFVYVTKLTNRLEMEGIVKTESKGKKRVIKLTEKGMQIANAIEELYSRLET